MIIGYGRTSTIEQEAGLEAQKRDLRAAGAKKLFTERVSSVAKRDVLEQALDFTREGDVFMVAKLDRLARSVADLLAIDARLRAKGAALVVLSMGDQPLDTRTPTGKLMLTLLGAVAEFERSLMLERQRDGIAQAKAEGKYKGRAPTARAKADQIKALKAEGLGASAIAERLGIGRASVYRVMVETQRDEWDREEAAQDDQIRAMKAEGMKAADIAERLGIGRAVVYQKLKAAQREDWERVVIEAKARPR